MPGTMVTFGTKYVWNFGKNRDLVCLEHQSNRGLDMPGTFENFKTRIVRTSYTLVIRVNLIG